MGHINFWPMLMLIYWVKNNKKYH